LDTLIDNYSKLSNVQLIDIGEFLLTKTEQNTYFEYQVAKTKENLAEVYSAKADYYKAAKLLSDINFDSANLKYPKEEKIEKYLRIAEYYFECDDATMAETYVRKCSPLVDDKVSKELRLRFEVNFAKSMDSNKKFLQAASKYQWLAVQPGIDEEDSMSLLNSAITCGILGPAGPYKARVLASLVNDERSKRNSHYELLSKMHQDRIVHAKDAQSLADSLQVHQKVIIWEGFTVLQKAIIEHNIVAVSRLYENISATALAKVLEVSDYQCEKLLQVMIGEKRLNASIDQVTRFVDFTSDHDAYTNWTSGINLFCTKLDKLVSKISSA